jgi:uncharacterized membrane protein YphA (DoxX/SURF4 family)
VSAANHSFILQDFIMHERSVHAIPTAQQPRQTSVLYWCFLLLLCSAYLQGAIEKAFDFPAALAEMRHFGIAPAGPFALMTIGGELAASFLILGGMKRWAGAVYLALFTLAANLVANRFWELAGPARTFAENGFFEHLGLAGAFMIVAYVDLRGWSPVPAKR